MPIKLTGLALVFLLVALPARAELPEGYFVWSKGDEGNFSSRKIYRMTLPDKTDVMALTSGEDVECQISPDGKWVAYAKAKLPNTDYHQFDRWKLYLVSIDGGSEIEIDADGYWPSWGGAGVLFYSKADGEHTHITRVEIDEQGNASNQTTVLSTETAFPSIPEINECFMAPDGSWFAGMAPDGSWFAGRTRQIADSGVGAYQVQPPEFNRLAWAGGSGCMPYVAPDGQWGYIAGSSSGIRWGDAPHVQNRLENQQLIAAKPGGGVCYHPGVSTDGEWFMTGHSQDADQNAGAWDIYIYKLDQRAVSDEQVLVSGGFNGWPHLWVGVVEQRDGGEPDAPSDGEDGWEPPDADSGTGTDTGTGTDRGGDAELKGSCACSTSPSASVCMGLLVLIVWRRRGNSS
jgi:hypothetical protein